MANKRMFSLQIVDTDAFLEMPMSSQLLYFHLSMRADDEGFVGNPKKIIKIIGSNEDDFKILIAKRFILDFESGVVVIKHWLIHNTIRMDRFNPTKYEEEKKSLITKENGSYSELATTRQPLGNRLETQVKLSEVNLIESKLSEYHQTPENPTQLFFDNEEDQIKLLIKVQEKYGNPEIIQREFKKFIQYWTEPNVKGKPRWQLEKTYEAGRRLERWLNNVKEFKNDSKGRKIWT